MRAFDSWRMVMNVIGYARKKYELSYSIHVDLVEIFQSKTFLEQNRWLSWVAFCRAAAQLALEFSDPVGDPARHIGAHLACIEHERYLRPIETFQTYWFEWCRG